MSRIWLRNPPPITVELKDAYPDSFQWEGKHHPIKEITNSWELEGGLRRDLIHRDYFLVITRGDEWTIIFYDHLADTWHLQGFLD